jgi:putative sigma-54 modulation protein
MQTTVTFRHVDPTPALRRYAEEKLARVVKKYLRRPGDAHVILGVHKANHLAEITLQADHTTFFAKETTGDLYAAIDLACEKLEHQAQKLKQKRAGRKRLESGRNGAPLAEAPSAVDRAPRLVRMRVPATPLSVDDAVERLAASDDSFLAFVDEETRGLAVLVRRADGRFGLIQAPAAR